jgi:peptide/nickel transport system substrate-binding protein
MVSVGSLLAACSSDSKTTSDTSAGGATSVAAASSTTATSAATDASASSAASDSTAATTVGSADATETSAQGDTPQGGLVRVGIGSEPETLDVFKSRAGTNNYILLNIFEQLLTHNADGDLVGNLAEEWSASDDGLTYDFTLRANAKFHNGDPVTSEDVKFSFERYVDPATENVFAYQLAGLDHVEVIDDTHFQVVLTKPDGAFLSSGAYVYIIPKAYFEKVGEAEFANNPVGTAPWKFVSRAIGESVTLTRFDEYWGDKPGYSDLEFRIVPDDNSRVSALRSGELDVIAQVPPQSIETLEGDDNLKVVTTVTGDNIFLIFNSKATDKPWGNQKVRQAMAMAIDNEAIKDSVLGGLGVLMSGVSPLNEGWDESAVEQPEYDPDAAQALLEEAGFGDGFSIDLFGPVNGRLPNSEQYIQAVAGFWEDIGISVNVQLVAYSQYVDMERATSDLNGVVMGLYGDSLTFDPQARLQGTMVCEGPYSHVCDTTLDGMVATVATTTDPDERVQAYKDTFDYINEQRYAIWGYTSEGAFAMNKDVDWTPYTGIPYTRMNTIAPAG